MAGTRPFKRYEPKWQAAWEEEGLYRAKDASKNKKFYGLIEFPYPSGEGLHTGHPRSYTAIDIVTRKRRMEGKNVLYPIGWDAFGLPTESYAIKTKTKPQDATAKNVANFRRQLKSLGFGFDWSREVNTTDPAYYKWTQWMFLQFFKATFDDASGRAVRVENPDAPVPSDSPLTAHRSPRMAYKARTTINWCPNCKIGLANEEAIGGLCERCGNPVEKRVKEQWMIRITKYADRLLNDLETVDYLEKIKTQQVNWIGKSEGAFVDFEIRTSGRQDIGSSGSDKTRVFTTRPDTLFGATYLVLAPEHEFVQRWIHEGRVANKREANAYREAAAKKSEMERQAEGREKTGVVLEGVTAINPANSETIPVWIADYVLAGYGTGAIMAVPAHDERDHEFAKKFELTIKAVIKPKRDIWAAKYSEVHKQQPHLYIETPEQEREWQKKIDNEFEQFIRSVKDSERPWSHEGFVMDSSPSFDGLYCEDASIKMTAWLEEKGLGERATTYRLRDWVFSRQRYWGEPIPIIICKACGYVPVPEDELPVLLPDVESYQPTDTGESPLSKIRSWVEVSCPSCGGEAERETDTMPNWAGSSWYFLRYCDPHNNKAFADSKKLKYWMPVDLYNGGMEHTTLHLLYSRFWHKFLWDLGAVPKEAGPEPYKVRRSHGLVMAQGGEKMSKSKGNVVNPDDIVEQYGADVFRIYEMFMGPFAEPVPWDTNGIEGVRRFLDKAWKLYSGSPLASVTPEQETLYHQTVKKVSDDIESLSFNTAVSQLMILTNAFVEAGGVPQEFQEGYLKILAPFAPHISEELWRSTGHDTSIHLASWPSFDPSKAVAQTFELVVQVNGKVRDRFSVPADISEEDAKARALASENVKKHLGDKKPSKVIYVKGRLVTIAA